MLLITYGMPRSASTFAWQLTYDLINYKHKQHIIKEEFHPEYRPNFLNNIREAFPSLIENVPSSSYYVVKTHGEYDDSFRKYEESGQLKIICSIRNPFDSCVSLIDVHNKEMQSGNQRPGFEEMNSIEKAVEAVCRDIAIAEKWLAAFNPLIIKYEEVLQGHASIIKSIVDHIGIETYLYDKVYNFYLDKGNITEFNKGISGRGESLKSRLDDDTVNTFNRFIERYLT